MKHTLVAVLTVTSTFLSTITQAQESDAVGNVADPFIGVVLTELKK